MAGPTALPTLFESRFPALARALPRLALGPWPTPLEESAGLAAALGLPRLLVKRDDRSGTVYGGNKVRKLQYLLAEAQSRGADAVLTFGATGSNHALATAMYAHELGLRCYAILTEQLPSQHVTDTLRQHARLGTTVIRATTYAETLAIAARVKAEHPGGPAKVYEIPWGGSSWLGTVGFVAAAFELAEQLRTSSLPVPGDIYIPCGSLGSAVGLALGLRVAGLPSLVQAVKVVPQNAVKDTALVELFTQVNREIHGRDPSFPLVEEPLRNLRLRNEFLGEGYAYPTPLALEAQALAREQGLKVDVTYAGKALSALLGDARAREERASPASAGPALYWATLNSRTLPV